MNKAAVFAALTASFALVACGQSGQSGGLSQTSYESSSVNLYAETVTQNLDGSNRRVTDFQTGQLCQVYTSTGIACTSFDALNEQQTVYVAAQRAKLDNAKAAAKAAAPAA